MSDLGSCIKVARKKAGFTQLQFAERLDIGRSSLAQYEANIYKPSIETLTLMAKILNIDVNELMGETKKVLPVKTVPIISNASCGACEVSVYEDENRVTYVRADIWKPGLYSVIASGSSMSPEIDDGDEVVLDPDTPYQDGDLVLYKIDNEIAIKIFYRDTENNMLQFIPYNSSDCFKTRVIRLDDNDEILNKLEIHKVIRINKTIQNNRAARLKMVGR